jgi:hypothetical protein
VACLQKETCPNCIKKINKKLPTIKKLCQNVVRFSLGKKTLKIFFWGKSLTILRNFVTKHSILMFEAEILPQKKPPKKK